MWNVVRSGLCCLVFAFACKTTHSSESKIKLFGADIPATNKPYKLMPADPFSFTASIHEKFELLSAAAGSKAPRTLSLYKAVGLDDEGLVLEEKGHVEEGKIFSRAQLTFIQRSDLLRLDNSPGFLLSYIGPKDTILPFAFMLQSSGEILSFCDEKDHYLQSTMDPDAPLKSFRFRCDLNLKDHFELRLRKDDNDKRGLSVFIL